MTKKIAIDFDDTIMNVDNVKSGYTMGEPVEGSVESLNYLAESYSLICFTNRATSPSAIKAVSDWLRYFKFPPMMITNIKPNADLFIDNLAISFKGDWSETLMDVEELLG